METSDMNPGLIITNGSSAMKVTRRVERDGRWGGPAWRGECISLEEFGGNRGMTDSVPEYLLHSWRPVPFEWSPVIGGGLEERYVWGQRHRTLQRELRVVDPRHDEAECMLDEITGRYYSRVCELPACGCSGEAHA